MKILNQYQNGNYSVTIYDDGTKIRETEGDEFISMFPENIDVKITNYCDAGCPMCHEDSNLKGKHGKLDVPFFDTLLSGTEIAIGGGNPLSHPDLEFLLEKLYNKGVIANITVNQLHFLKQENLEKLKLWQSKGWIHGIGVSLTFPSNSLIENCKLLDNVVIHAINGYHPYWFIEELFGKNLKLLILGFKSFRRGLTYSKSNIDNYQKTWYTNIHKIIKGFDVVSFDNLAIDQLKVKRLMTDDMWNTFYMGDDGGFTFYVDLVEKKFAKNSISEKRYPLMNNVLDMFTVVKGEN